MRTILIKELNMNHVLLEKLTEREQIIAPCIVLERRKTRGQLGPGRANFGVNYATLQMNCKSTVVLAYALHNFCRLPRTSAYLVRTLAGSLRACVSMHTALLTFMIILSRTKASN